MTIDRSERIAFEEVADLYDEVRPGYPDELIDDILSLSEIPAAGRILEVGCGPGKATVAFARHGYNMLCLELGARLAALARKNCRAYPWVEVRHVTFEDWELEERAFDLAISAEAFHWIPPEIAYLKAARALKDSGSLALFWYVDLDEDTVLHRSIDAVYRQETPQFENPSASITVEWLVERIRANFAASASFGPVTVKQYPVSETYSGGRYVKLLRTSSTHRRLDEEARQRLFAGIREVIERHGGTITRPSLVVLFHARVARSRSNG